MEDGNFVRYTFLGTENHFKQRIFDEGIIQQGDVFPRGSSLLMIRYFSLVFTIVIDLDNKYSPVSSYHTFYCNIIYTIKYFTTIMLFTFDLQPILKSVKCNKYFIFVIIKLSLCLFFLKKYRLTTLINYPCRHS